uniref:hypothetical protein n=1 Tax=Streptomyces sp. NBC_01592 TaxID=2975889 RepID=UPI002F919523
MPIGHRVTDQVDSDRGTDTGHRDADQQRGITRPPLPASRGAVLSVALSGNRVPDGCGGIRAARGLSGGERRVPRWGNGNGAVEEFDVRFTDAVAGLMRCGYLAEHEPLAGRRAVTGRP